jgi:hypothetical protein
MISCEFSHRRDLSASRRRIPGDRGNGCALGRPRPLSYSCVCLCPRRPPLHSS